MNKLLHWLDIHISSRAPDLLKPWVRVGIFSCFVIVMWLVLGLLGSWSRYDGWSWIFDWVKPGQMLDVIMILFTLQVPILIFGVRQIMNSGYVSRKALSKLLVFREVIIR